MRTNRSIGCGWLAAVALVLTSGVLLMLTLVDHGGTLVVFAALMLVVGLVQVVLAYRETRRPLPPKD